MRKVQFSFRAVDIGFLKRNGKADGGVEQLVVGGEVVHAAIEVVHVEPVCAEKPIGKATLVVISMRGFHRQAQDLVAASNNIGGAGEQNVLELRPDQILNKWGLFEVGDDRPRN